MNTDLRGQTSARTLKNKGVRWMPWHQMAMKDVAWLRKASGRCLATFDPEMSEWGNLIA